MSHCLITSFCPLVVGRARRQPPRGDLSTSVVCGGRRWTSKRARLMAPRRHSNRADTRCAVRRIHCGRSRSALSPSVVLWPPVHKSAVMPKPGGMSPGRVGVRLNHTPAGAVKVVNKASEDTRKCQAVHGGGRPMVAHDRRPRGGIANRHLTGESGAPGFNTGAPGQRPTSEKSTPLGELVAGGAPAGRGPGSLRHQGVQFAETFGMTRMGT